MVDAELTKALERRIRLRDLEARSGFSKSALHRHSQNCLPTALLSAYRQQKFVKPSRFVVLWPKSANMPAATAGADRSGLPLVFDIKNLSPEDVTIEVLFESFQPHPSRLRELEALGSESALN
jgi:hypothetical protein